MPKMWTDLLARRPLERHQKKTGENKRSPGDYGIRRPLETSRFLALPQKQGRKKKECVFHARWAGTRSHFRGISWNVPSGNVLLMVIGSMFISSSFSAMPIGLESPSVSSTSMGAPMEIWRALAPTTLAFSNRVIFGGPMVTLPFSDVF